MKVKELEARRDDVIGIVPVYTDRGNATMVYFSNGDVKEDYRGIKSVRANLLGSYAIDFNLQRSQMETILKRKGALPFFINNRVFIPLKLRRAVAVGDAVYGYVDVNYLRAIEPDEGEVKCVAYLTTDLGLAVYSSYTSAITSKEAGEKLLAHLKELNGVGELDRDIVKTVVAFLGSIRDINRLVSF